MKEIVLTRIDDRLIHGQVVTAWVKFYPADHIIIIDDELSKNMIMQRLYKAAAPTGITLKILSIEESLEFLNDGAPAKVMILVKTPVVLEEIINKGVPINKVILGGIGSSPDRKQFIKNVFASDLERQSMSQLISKDISIDYQLVPDDKAVNVKSLL